MSEFYIGAEVGLASDHECRGVIVDRGSGGWRVWWCSAEAATDHGAADLWLRPPEVDPPDFIRTAYEAGYRQGWRNGRCDRDEGDDGIGDDPGDSYELWCDESAGIPFGEEEDEEGLGEACEGCKAPAVIRDSDGIPLCGGCYDALDEVPCG